MTLHVSLLSCRAISLIEKKSYLKLRYMFHNYSDQIKGHLR